jgi:hypothetical protein
MIGNTTWACVRDKHPLLTRCSVLEKKKGERRHYSTVPDKLLKSSHV